MRKLLLRAGIVAVALALLAAPVAAEPPSATWIVVLSTADPDEAAAAHAREHGAEVSHVYRHALRGYAARMSAQAAARVADAAGVVSVEPDAVVTTAARPPKGGSSPAAEVTPWGVRRVGAVGGATGSGVHVYVLDTGIDADHPDLAVRLGDGYAVEACRGRHCRAPWDDDHGHGTHVAGTVAATDDDRDVVGVAPGAVVHAVKVLSKSGSGTVAGVIAGIDWVAQRTSAAGAASVANMSLGGSGSKTGSCTETGFTGSGAYHQAICGARHQGVVFAVAAGNNGVDASGSVPAAFDDAVVTTSATSCVATDQVCAVGTDDWPWWSNHGEAVALAAPGVDVLSTRMGGGTTTMSGTSMASPHVAGALARWLQLNPRAADGAAYVDGRAGLLGAAESTAGWTDTSGHAHAEPFLRAP